MSGKIFKNNCPDIVRKIAWPDQGQIMRQSYKMDFIDKSNTALIRSIVWIDKTYPENAFGALTLSINKGLKNLLSLRDPADNRLFGFVLFHQPNPKSIFIDRMYILDSPKYRRKGISRSLVKDLKSQFDEIRCVINPDDNRIRDKWTEMFLSEDFREDNENPGIYEWYRKK